MEDLVKCSTLKEYFDLLSFKNIDGKRFVKIEMGIMGIKEERR